MKTANVFENFKKESKMEKIIKTLKSSPYAKGDNIEGKFVITSDNSIEFTIGYKTNFATYVFDSSGDLLLTIVPRES